MDYKMLSFCQDYNLLSYRAYARDVHERVESDDKVL